MTEAGAEAIQVAPHILDTLSERDISQGLAVTFALNELLGSLTDVESTDHPTLNPKLILILDQLQDPGNLGTLIRTADAVGASAIILIEPCVDPFDPKTVRSTMGSIFTLPLIRTARIDDVFPRLSELGYNLIGADARRGTLAWQGDSLAGSIGLILGNEAHGLNNNLHQYLNNYVSLPLKGFAESLNVAVAGGALMYEWLRMNSNAVLNTKI